jgi:hypothetical protein
VPYFHVVFTLPSALNRLCLYEPKKMYPLLFKITWQVIQDFASNHKFLGAKPGMIAILHTCTVLFPGVVLPKAVNGNLQKAMENTCSRSRL